MPRLTLPAFAGLTLFLLGAFLGWQWRDKEARAVLEGLYATQSLQLAEAQQQARHIEQQLTQQLHQLEADYVQRQQQIESENRQLVDDLRTGTVRLRKQWQACAATMRLPANPPAAGVADAAPASGSAVERDIARIIAIGKQADSRLAACQQTIKQYQQITVHHQDAMK